MKTEPIHCTLDEMIDRDLLEVPLGGPPSPYKGFTVGKGKQLYWHYSPTPNGFYRIYPQYENGEIGRPRYVDGTKTKVTVWPE